MRMNPGDIVFLDGSLVLSFINELADEKIRRGYVDAIVSVLRTSGETKTPVAAYTDMPLNKDIVTLMKKYFRLPPVTHLSDAHLIRGQLNWADRTRTFVSDRDDKGREISQSWTCMGLTVTRSPSFIFNRRGACRRRWSSRSGPMRKGWPTVSPMPLGRSASSGRVPDIIQRAHEYTAISQDEAGQFSRILDRFAAENQIKIYKSAKEINKRLNEIG